MANIQALKDKYENEIRSSLKDKFNYSSTMQIPKITKIVLNMGMGEAVGNAKVLDNATIALEKLAGQKCTVRKAKKSIANFKLREGMPIGLAVTLRGKGMYSFLERLISATIPRIRDFRGISATAFDGRGNYTLGIKDILAFPEVDYELMDQTRGMNVTFVTTATTDEEAKALLDGFGFPFKKSN